MKKPGVFWMKKHVLRPLWVALAAVALVLIIRYYTVPEDFGVHGRNFTYGYFRKGAIDDWQAVSVKYRGKEYCNECHDDKFTENMDSRHSTLECESCHGPALEHPDNPETLDIDRSRNLCLRCHLKLDYPASPRGALPGIDAGAHNAGLECSECHNPHRPALEDMQ